MKMPVPIKASPEEAVFDLDEADLQASEVPHPAVAAVIAALTKVLGCQAMAASDGCA